MLTGYCTRAPKGITLTEGTYYNPYCISGGVLGMPPPLYDDVIEYEDGTPATRSQLAKDVTVFLDYMSHKSKELARFDGIFILTALPLIFQLYYVKRHVFSYTKLAKILFRHPKNRRFK